jgi:hypothetical protein
MWVMRMKLMLKMKTELMFKKAMELTLVMTKELMLQMKSNGSELFNICPRSLSIEARAFIGYRALLKA